MFFSIVVPLYNCEKYIEQCINSIMDQTFKDFEVIVVNDGSTDDSARIVSDCTKKYQNVHIITQQNRGLSGARNTGIREAKGKYIIFIDADDYVEKCLLEEIFQICHGQDIVLYGYYNDVVSNQKLVQTDTICFEGETLEECFQTMEPAKLLGMLGYAWNKAYKLQYIKEHKMQFQEGTSLIEDILFNREAILLADTITVSNKPLVHYMQRLQRETLSNKVYYGLSELLTEGLEARVDICKRYYGELCTKEMTQVFEISLVFLLNKAGVSLGKRAEEVSRYLEKNKKYYDVKYIKNPVLKVGIKVRSVKVIVAAYMLKGKLQKNVKYKKNS